MSSYHKYKHMLEHELESYMSFLFRRKLTLKQMADDLGCSQATASRLCKKYKIPMGVLHKNRTPYEKYGFGSMQHMLITISECLRAGMNKRQIAEEMKCNKRTIIRICNKYGI